MWPLFSPCSLEFGPLSGALLNQQEVQYSVAISIVFVIKRLDLLKVFKSKDVFIRGLDAFW